MESILQGVLLPSPLTLTHDSRWRHHWEIDSSKKPCWGVKREPPLGCLLSLFCLCSHLKATVQSSLLYLLCVFLQSDSRLGERGNACWCMSSQLMVHSRKREKHGFLSLVSTQRANILQAFHVQSIDLINIQLEIVGNCRETDITEGVVG